MHQLHKGPSRQVKQERAQYARCPISVSQRQADSTTMAAEEPIVEELDLCLLAEDPILWVRRLSHPQQVIHQPHQQGHYSRRSQVHLSRSSTIAYHL